jgi:hypothetical protein
VMVAAGWSEAQKRAYVLADAQVAAIAASIKEWGWTTPALVGEDGGLIAGHARVLAARQLGIAEIPVMVAAGWSEAQKRAYVLADNQLAITGSGWDPELLRLELGELKLSGFDLSLTGFGELELKDLLAERTEGLTDPDDVPAVPEHPVSQTGDLWLLGRHRLLCGDSTVATDVERVLGGGEPHLMVTDPPYGVEYDAGWRGRSSPAASSGEDSDETGIIVAGKDKQSRGYVLADLSGRYTPIEWARIAVAAYKAHGADRIVAEVNNGGEMGRGACTRVRWG